MRLPLVWMMSTTLGALPAGAQTLQRAKEGGRNRVEFER
jgi:hypothetical protein